MEFIITGLFIIFFSYILLCSLYDILFKRSTIEGLDNGGEENDNKDDEESQKEKDADTQKKGDKALSDTTDANSKIEEQNKKRPNATLEAGMKIANTNNS